MTRVILASASPRRRELLRALLADFEVLPADIPEDPGDDPRAGALRLATEKAATLAARNPGAVVIGSDTIVHDGVRPYGKPADMAEANSMLSVLRGREHRVFTGVAVVAEPGGTTAGVSISRVTLAGLDDGTIAEYVASGRPLDKAGSYAIQDEDVPTVHSLEGCYCGVMGLPLWLTRGLLQARGISCADPSATFPRCAVCPERA